MSAQLLSILLLLRRDIQIGVFSITRENPPRYPLVTFILSSLCFATKAANLAVYLDISWRYIAASSYPKFYSP